ncbi:MAG: MBL fold metallo-hydrolase [Planctomycetota bacterium]|nr:MAG: MBL fold metallo-hydrolase [Planctomycetota bacterium]
MILRKTMNSRWLSNSWLVADRPGGKAVLIDAGGPMAPILQWLQEERLELTHVLCTHHHVDHVLYAKNYRQRFQCPICGHHAERELFGDLQLSLQDGEEIRSGDLHLRAMHIPGHTLGQLAFLLNGNKVFTGDTLFRGSVGGTRGPGHTHFQDLQHSIMEVLMRLAPETEVYPGHMEATTIAREWQENPFIRMWRGLDSPAASPCTAAGKEAELLLKARDYDGGYKCWVRFADGSTDLIGGSQLQEP